MGQRVMSMKKLILQIKGCVSAAPLAFVIGFVAPFAFVIGFNAGRAVRSAVQAPVTEEPLAGVAAAEPVASEAPAVRPDEACFYSRRYYKDLIGCVQAGKSLTVARVSVQSVVLGKNVAVASTAHCKFYGPDVAYVDTTASDCSTDRLWMEPSRPFNGT
jgi:hypothetical protein